MYTVCINSLPAEIAEGAFFILYIRVKELSRISPIASKISFIKPLPLLLTYSHKSEYLLIGIASVSGVHPDTAFYRAEYPVLETMVGAFTLRKVLFYALALGISVGGAVFGEHLDALGFYEMLYLLFRDVYHGSDQVHILAVKVRHG